MEPFLFECLKIANASRYPLKEEFYKLKNKLLPQLGTYDGLDAQNIKVPCRVCDGRGVWRYWQYWNADTCWTCNGTGVFRIDTHYLQRWIINDEVFHLIHYDDPAFGDLSSSRPIIKGRIKHEDSGKDLGTFAFIQLLHEFNPVEFEELKAGDYQPGSILPF